MSKGSNRRPSEVSSDEFARSWDRIFTKLVPEGSYLDVPEVGADAVSEKPERDDSQD